MHSAVDVSRVILCAAGMIEFKVEGQISLNAQLRQSSLDDLSEVVSRAAWGSQSSLSRFVIEPDGDRFGIGLRTQPKETEELFDFRADKFSPTWDFTGPLILLHQLLNEGICFQ